RNLFRICPRLEAYRPANADLDSPRWSKPFARALHFKQSYNPHREYRNAKIFRQQPDPRTKRIHLAILRVPTFRKDQQAVSAVHGLARISKTLPEPSFAGQR